ncbi:protein SPA1-RELATED 3-like isoform X2 [Diospyros lotus]|uniref:protein SPA1-RELATED 3-like isoform X2 n=1 Tax=Diospyros lotus TaxID=55363 RepID=UPI00225002A3|nr:protein SPA1-RELATED 3-like isoform X2 [Diospyros lotus]
MTMENSSESGWQRSDSSRGFNASAVSDRNPRLFRASRIRSSSDASHDSGFIPGGKERERNVFTNRDVRERSTSVSAVCKDEIAVHPVVCGVDWTDISLRQWLDNPERSVDAIECLHIFTQIVQIIELAHSEGIVVHNVRPSCFVISSFNSVSFLESSSCSDSGSDSLGDGSNSQTAEFKGSSSLLPRESHQQSSQFRRENSLHGINPRSLYPTRNSFEAGSDVEQVEEKKQSFPMKQILLLESNWYTSPEEVGGAPSSCASDIYRLGVLLFELFCTFSSSEEKSSTMSSLRHRVLPPQLLLKWPKEASFCLWLLHPDPSSRPKMSDLLQSEFLNEPRNNIEERQAAIDLRERIEEQELLLEFLTLIQQRKQVAADNLQDTISFISSDIEEASKKQSVICKKGRLCPEVGRDPSSGAPLMEAVENEDSGCSGSRKRYRQGLHSYNAEEADDPLLEDQSSKASAGNQGCILVKSCRLMKNFKKLETAYFLTRRRAIKQSGKSSACHPPISAIGRGSITSNERNSNNNFPWNVQSSEERQSGWINSFFEGLCKYLSLSKLQVKADLKQGDLINSSNLVCSLSFDRDGELFATAGVNKKIKIFEYHRILNEDRDIHYPVVELASRSKLSSICWNSYIKSQIASSNFEGVVQVWDVTRSQVYMEMREHERRVWSVDFSLADPMMLASGSDDGSVKLWNINQGVSVGTVRTKANVCCVQFPINSGCSLAFGSADHRIYYYDLRNLKAPLCTLTGHNKTVSYVKFIDSTNLVSASTDNTIKLWDLSTCTSQISFTGHTNVKNFVGLSVSDGYIATGSETNEVYVYHKAFPMPASSFKFGSTDPFSGDDDAPQFISSVCWRGQTSSLVAANSTGNIKLLEMV